MPKVEIKICLGTTCFVMGSTHLQELPDLLPAKYRASVTISGCPCLGQCSRASTQAPYVRVGGEIISEATIEKILAKIESIYDQQ